PDLSATVSASAGTGKTWLLVTRIIRLLLADTEPGSILALTFTRKAAAEMQMRLQERLYQLATADDSTLTELLTQAGITAIDDHKIKSRELYERLLHADFPVRLQTFHSFCQDILSHFPLEADITPGFELIENTALLRQQALEELFADATRNAQGKLANDLDVLMQACNGPANTKTALNSMLGHRSDWWAFCEHCNDNAAYASQQLQKQLQIDVNTDPYIQFFSVVTREKLLDFVDLLRKHATKTNLGHAQQIEHALQAESLTQSTFQRLQAVFLTARYEPRTRKPSKTQAANMGEDGETAFLELHHRICTSMLDAREISKRIQALELNAVWYRTGQRYIELYQQLKRELRVLDFTDLEWNCYRLLNTADNAHWVQYKIDQRINHVLIDEFQDTNPTQWQLITPLLEEIAAGPGERARSFFLVGDEKQSIYSFRRANPELQRQASHHLAENVSAVAVRLDASRRSSPAIVETVNAVFKQDEIQRCMPEFSDHNTHLQQLPGSVSLYPLCQLDHDTAQQADDLAATALRNPLLAPRVINTRTARTDEAKLIADQIDNFINEQTLISAKDQAGNDCVRPIEYGDIMILMRNRTHIGIYESVLRDRGIPFTGSQRGSLLENQEIQDLEKLLDSLMAPFNNLSIAQVLKSPIFAASDADLMYLAQASKQGKWYQRLLALNIDPDKSHPLYRAARLLPRWQKLVDTVPVHDLLDRIYAEGNIIQRYVSSVPASQQQRVSANLLRFLELSLELDSGRYPSLSHFLHHLRSIRAHKDGRPDEPAVTEGQASVQLMTIHASKGLEAPMIVLADCDNQGKHNNAYTTLVDWPAQHHRPVRFQLITGQQSMDQTTAEIVKRKQSAQHREELNLLYVALTRARQYLTVTGSACRDKSGWFEYLETAMKLRLKPDPDSAYHIRFGHYKKRSIPEKKHVVVQQAPVVDPRLRRPLPMPAAAEQMIAPSQRVHEDQHVNTSQDADGSQRGIVIHRALDLMSRRPPLTADQVRLQIRQESSMADDIELDRWLDEARRTLNDVRFACIFKPTDYRKVMNELPVLYQDDDKTVFGLIDRLIVNDDSIILIDYKTHQVDDEAQLDTLAREFSHQLSLYKKGVSKLWPNIKINSGLLFTHSAHLLWID
ncbi:MAG: UvrD-helicase domain-containing protein, partial [Gammaproteobacteria bacterium]|nr:UvrD-helicase domain-containing protein [Gammaproteobacteria bacterium]